VYACVCTSTPAHALAQMHKLLLADNPLEQTHRMRFNRCVSTCMLVHAQTLIAHVLACRFPESLALCLSRALLFSRTPLPRHITFNYWKQHTSTCVGSKASSLEEQVTQSANNNGQNGLTAAAANSQQHLRLRLLLLLTPTGRCSHVPALPPDGPSGKASSTTQFQSAGTQHAH
jgi:hypothetical protein